MVNEHKFLNDPKTAAVRTFVLLPSAGTDARDNVLTSYLHIYRRAHPRLPMDICLSSVCRSLHIPLDRLPDRRLSIQRWAGKRSHLFLTSPEVSHQLIFYSYSILVLAQPKPGVDQGPIHLVNAGLPEQLRELGWNVLFDGHHQFDSIDEENDPPIGVLKNPRLVSRVSQAVADAVGSHAKKGHLPVTIGGDHSLVSWLMLYSVVNSRLSWAYVLYCRPWARFPAH